MTNKEQFEKLTSSFLAKTDKTHEDRFGGTVYIYDYNYFKDAHDFRNDILNIFQRCAELPTGSNHVIEFFDVKMLVSVSWWEHDVYVMFYENIKELEKSVENSMKFYSEDQAAKYDFSAELFLLFQDDLLKDVI